MPQDGPRSRGPQPDPKRRPAPGVADMRGRLLSGHGSPEGSVHAGAGTLYQDVSPAGSGAVHKKTTPSGSTGWVELGTGGGGGGGALTWTLLPHSSLGPGVANGNESDLTDNFNVAYAYDDNYLHLRGFVKPNDTGHNAGTWSNGGMLFHVPLHGTGLEIGNHPADNTQRFAATTAAVVPNDYVFAKLIAAVVSDGTGGHYVRVDGTVADTVGFGSTVYFACDVRFPLG